MKYIATESFESGEWITKGKIYEVIDNKITFDDGWVCTFLNDEFLDKKPLESYFEPYVEELPQPTKSLLKDGDYVINRKGEKYITSLKFNRIIDEECNYILIVDLTNELEIEHFKQFDIMEIYRNGELIAKRDEESEKESKIGEIKDKLEELADELEELRERGIL